MSSPAWKAEVSKLLALSSDGQRVWLANFLYALTVLARDTYTVGGDGLDDARRMRRFNELLHRTATQLRDHIRGNQGRPMEVFADIVEEAIEEVDLNPEDLRKLMG